MLKSILLVVALAFPLTACEAVFRGTPKDSISPARDFNAIIINGTLEESRLRYLAAQPFVDAVTRNAVIDARIAEIDILYYAYENNISAEIRRGNFATSIAGILVGAAGAQAAGRAGQNLSALSGVISGGSAAYQKEVLLNQSIQAFTSQMRANRNAKKTVILKKLGHPGTAYTLQAALADLASYQQAGTLASAVAGITETAKIEEEASGTILQSVEGTSIEARETLNRTPLNSSPVSRSIPAFIAAGTTEADRRARLERARNCFAIASVANKPTRFSGFLLNQGNHPELARAIARCLGI